MATNRFGWVGIVSVLLLGIRGLAADVTNQPPQLRIIRPQNGELFAGPMDLRLVAYAQDREDGYKLNVEFFEGNHSLGSGIFVPSLCPAPYCPNFQLTWSNVLAGTYTLSAVATDSQGASTTSDPVQIKVVEPSRGPIVTIFAKDPFASELSPLVAAAPDTARFVVRRSGGSLDDPLTVAYRISGTASNGVDYDQLPGEVTIPRQSETAEIVVNPIDDALAEGTETIVLTLSEVCPPCVFADPPCLPPIPIGGCYLVGFPGEAIAFLRDNDPSNLQPKVEILKPQNGATFAPLSDVEFDLRTLDPDGWVHSVEFFANGVKVGEETVEFIQEPPPGQEQVFSLVWSNVTTGKYILTAKATDDRDASSWSAPVTITVGDVPPPVPVVTVVATDPFASEFVSTNGTNTATFRIFRTGPTNLDLTVFYSLHGTASNGVDYAELGNSATIAAGRRSARVVIVPLDDNLEEGIETVLLKLEPDPTLGPVARYEIGRPGKAGAIIVDNEARQPRCLRLQDGSFHLFADRPDGFAYRLEVSEDLSLWVSLCTNMVTDGALRFVDPEALEHRHRFYRVVPQSNYVPEE